jgi:type III pantothenate kinase
VILAVDAGNSRVKWGLHHEGKWLAQGSVANADLAELPGQWTAHPTPEVAVISNVAGSAMASALEQLLPSGPQKTYWVTPQKEQCGVKNGYVNPAQLGSDRWAALIAARDRIPTSCVVVSSGTALTVDALTAEGHFLGGFIVPGLRLLERTLEENTAAIPLATGCFQAFPDNTADACRSGALAALSGAVERMRRQVMQETGTDCPCLVSGGDAPLLLPLLASPVLHVENLVLEGLIRIAQS